MDIRCHPNTLKTFPNAPYIPKYISIQRNFACKVHNKVMCSKNPNSPPFDIHHSIFPNVSKQLSNPPHHHHHHHQLMPTKVCGGLWSFIPRDMSLKLIMLPNWSQWLNLLPCHRPCSLSGSQISYIVIRGKMNKKSRQCDHGKEL